MDFEKLAATAKRLIDKNGREVSIIRFDRTPADTDKPWKGPDDPRLTPAATVDTKAVFVPPSSASELGMSTIDNDLVKRSEQIMIVAADGIADDLSIFNEVLDQETHWKIIGTELLRPATTPILYFIGVVR